MDWKRCDLLSSRHRQDSGTESLIITNIYGLILYFYSCMSSLKAIRYTLCLKLQALFIRVLNLGHDEEESK